MWPSGQPPCDAVLPGQDAAIAQIESAMHALARWLRQARLHEFLLKQAGVDIDQAGLAVLYVLHSAGTSLRLTDLADRLRIDAPAVTRKAQLLERLALVSRAQDPADARAARLQLTSQGRQVISQFLLARRDWLTELLAAWPTEERCQFARLLSQFADDIHQHLADLDCLPHPVTSDDDK